MHSSTPMTWWDLRMPKAPHCTAGPCWTPLHCGTPVIPCAGSHYTTICSRASRQLFSLQFPLPIAGTQLAVLDVPSSHQQVMQCDAAHGWCLLQQQSQVFWEPVLRMTAAGVVSPPSWLRRSSLRKADVESFSTFCKRNFVNSHWPHQILLSCSCLTSSLPSRLMAGKKILPTSPAAAVQWGWSHGTP